MKVEHINITIPPELREAVDAQAEREHTRRSPLIQKAVRVYLGLARNRALRRLLQEGYQAMAPEARRAVLGQSRSPQRLRTGRAPTRAGYSERRRQRVRFDRHHRPTDHHALSHRVSDQCLLAPRGRWAQGSVRYKHGKRI